MARRKLKHFAEMAALPNVLEYPENMPGRWAEHFGNSQPIVLELGCGTGAYTISLADRYPEKNFIGIDIKGARMWHGATAAHEAGKANVAFLRIVIENIAEYFAPNEVSEIWITFPDPHPREGKARKRLCSPRFHEIYRKFIRPEGELHLKTDNQELFQYALDTTEEALLFLETASNDIDRNPPEAQDLDITTTYEQRYRSIGKPICYGRWRQK